ncbi:ArdC family protein [Oligella urethralis]|uniref:ArdC family protein n=1 Tax=Oligella urethralis TaxID=90245 RepID=UPI00036E290E|nr:zincin-like metallopeptidase domain-containing protein [Oligella urethralis]SUA67683.1 DNA primase TraC [Oligella urethralis]
MTSKTDKTDKAVKKSFAEQFSEKIIEMLEAGTAPWQKPWDGQSAQPAAFNAVTGHEYQGANKMWLSIQPFNDPRWMTFNQAKSEGWSVKKGSKGTAIQVFITDQEKVKRDEQGKPVKDEQGQDLKEKERLKRPLVRTFYVFNAEQIEGIPELKVEPQPEQQWEPLKRAEVLLKESGAEIEHLAIDKAFYRPSQDKIVLPMPQQFDDAGKYYATALHELGHWTGHPSRLDRPLVSGFGTPDYAREELRAEIASMMVGQELGIKHDPEQHVSYVGAWIKALKEDPQEIVRACADAEKIKTFVMQFDLEKNQVLDAPVKPPEQHTAQMGLFENQDKTPVSALPESPNARDDGLSLEI